MTTFSLFLAQIGPKFYHIKFPYIIFLLEKEELIDQKDKNHIGFYYLSVGLRCRSENCENYPFYQFLTQNPKQMAFFKTNFNCNFISMV